MKLRNAIITLAALLVLFSGGCDKDGGGSSDWAVKIDNEVITIEEFEYYYYTQAKLLLNIGSREGVDKMAARASQLRPELQMVLNKRMFLEQLISHKLLYKQAKNDPKVDKKELDTLVEMQKLQIVSQYYLSKQLKDDITVTQKEIEEYYRENRRRFKGMPMNDAVVMNIKQRVQMLKFRKKSNEYLMELLAENKVKKEGFNRYMKEQEKANKIDDKSSKKEK